PRRQPATVDPSTQHHYPHQHPTACAGEPDSEPTAPLAQLILATPWLEAFAQQAPIGAGQVDTTDPASALINARAQVHQREIGRASCRARWKESEKQTSDSQ